MTCPPSILDRQPGTSLTLHGLVLPTCRRGLDMHLDRSLPTIGWFGVCGQLVRAAFGEVTGDWSSYVEWTSALVFTGVIKTSCGACVSTIILLVNRYISSFLGAW